MIVVGTSPHCPPFRDRNHKVYRQYGFPRWISLQCTKKNDLFHQEITGNFPSLWSSSEVAFSKGQNGSEEIETLYCLHHNKWHTVHHLTHGLKAFYYLIETEEWW